MKLNLFQVVFLYQIQLLLIVCSILLVKLAYVVLPIVLSLQLEQILEQEYL